MKKSIFTLVLISCVTATMLTSCKSSTNEEKESQERVETAREDVQNAKDTLAEAKRVATEQEWIAFKESSDSIIRINDMKIAQLKLKMKNSNKSIDAKYEENMATLDQKNEALKIKMVSYKNDANSDWQSFKREFNHDMDEIGQAFKDLTVDNKK
jgi:uncharacterized protein (DUF342 family)